MFSFLTDYHAYVGETESPPIYHTWCALSTLSHLLGWRVWTDQAVYIATPQLYILLVGEAGIKKSSAMRRAEKIVRNFKKIQIAAASITKEMIVKTMGEENSKCKLIAKCDDRVIEWSQLSIFGDEFVTMLNAGGDPLGMIDFLTRMWGADLYDDATKNRGSFAVKNPYISILACLTTETLKQLHTNKVITGGMARRCFIVYAEKNGTPIPFPKKTPEQDAAKARCIAHGNLLETFTGEFSWTDEAQAVYEDFYCKAAAFGDKCTSAVLRSFYQTKGEFVIKVSMILRCAEYPPSLVHTKESVLRSIELVTQVENGASIIFDGQGANKLVDLLESVERLLKKESSALTYGQIKGRVWKDVPDGKFEHLTSVLEQLVTMGKVQSSNEPSFSNCKFSWRG